MPLRSIALAKMVAAIIFAGVSSADAARAVDTSADVVLPSVHASLKVPSHLRAIMPIPNDVKALLDRDFRSRYPVAAPIKVDVVDAWVDMYSAGSVLDGYGGFDTRHYFRVVAMHATGATAYLDISIYERTIAEANQDRIFIESFRVVGWQP